MKPYGRSWNSGVLSLMIIMGMGAGVCCAVDVYPNVRYASSDVRHVLDLWVPDSDQPVPLVVYVHGGGWTVYNKGQFNTKRRTPLLDNGFATATINYRLVNGDLKKNLWPAQIHDCKAAIRYLRGNANTYGIDPNRIGVWGPSAGAQLVSILGTTNGVDSVTIDNQLIEIEGNLGSYLNVSSDVQAVCEWFGPTDFLMMEASSQLSNHVEYLLGGLPSGKRALSLSASPLTYIDSNDAPFLIVHGTNDPLVSIEQSHKFRARLGAAGVDVDFLSLAGAKHGGTLFETDATYQAVVNFFKRTLMGIDESRDDHLVGHWALDETSGDKALDQTVNGYDGTTYRVAWVKGRIGGAMEQDGVDDGMAVPTIDASPPVPFGLLDQGTISVWFKYQICDSEMLPVFYYGEPDTGVPNQRLLIALESSARPSRRTLTVSIADAGFGYALSGTLCSDAWYHLAVSVSPVGNTCFLDGNESYFEDPHLSGMCFRKYRRGSESSRDFFSSVQAKDLLAVGYGRDSAANAFVSFNGLIDDLRIYDRALDALEIQQLYLAGVRDRAADLDGSGQINLADVAWMSARWLRTECWDTTTIWCDGSDLDFDNSVTYDDIRELLDHWLESVD